jgi:hypothetical protein
MAKSPEATSTTQPVDGVASTVEETSRQTQSTARGALTSVRPFVTQTLATNRTLLQVWATGIEASIKAGFAVRRALMSSIPHSLTPATARAKARSRRGRMS